MGVSKVNSALGIIKSICVLLPALDVGSFALPSSAFATGFKPPERLSLTCSRDCLETWDLATRPLGAELAATADGGKAGLLAEDAMDVFLREEMVAERVYEEWGITLELSGRGAYVFTRFEEVAEMFKKLK